MILTALDAPKINASNIDDYILKLQAILKSQNFEDDIGKMFCKYDDQYEKVSIYMVASISPFKIISLNRYIHLNFDHEIKNITFSYDNLRIYGISLHFNFIYCGDDENRTHHRLLARHSRRHWNMHPHKNYKLHKVCIMFFTPTGFIE